MKTPGVKQFVDFLVKMGIKYKKLSTFSRKRQIMKKEEYKELRSEVRKAAANGASVEFKPAADSMSYQFSLRDWSSTGLGILAREDSRLLRHLKTGQVMSVILHKGEQRLPSEKLKAEIRHIVDPEEGKHPSHKIVGLKILSREEM